MTGKFTLGHWRYYSDKYSWDDKPGFELADRDFSLATYKANGLSDKQAEDLFDAGYFCSEDTGIVIDRYYGGAIRSLDMVSRFDVDDLQQLFEKPRSGVWIKSATSLNEVYNIIDEAQSRSSRRLMFRGQSQHYFINRKINNPNFTIAGLGEISFLSSFWRRALAANKNSWMDFESLSLLEWSTIFYSTFDIDEIHQRHQNAIDKGELSYSDLDMANSSDPLLREFGQYRLDLILGKETYLQDLLSTMLQHYGLLSPVIDLTTSPDVALFFATHKLSSDKGLSKYTFNGTNKGKAVIHLIRDGKTEFVPYRDDPFLQALPPERPIRQHCVVSRSNAYCVNLPGLFLDGIINLEFDLAEVDSPCKPAELFPGEADDKFLKALRGNLLNPHNVTFFG